MRPELGQIQILVERTKYTECNHNYNSQFTVTFLLTDHFTNPLRENLLTLLMGKITPAARDTPLHDATIYIPTVCNVSVCIHRNGVIPPLLFDFQLRPARHALRLHQRLRTGRTTPQTPYKKTVYVSSKTILQQGSAR